MPRYLLGLWCIRLKRKHTWEYVVIARDEQEAIARVLYEWHKDHSSYPPQPDPEVIVLDSPDADVILTSFEQGE
jgi:hypothetical protein